MDILCTIDKENLYHLNDKDNLPALNYLEQGKIIFFPKLGFKLINHEKVILNNNILQSGKKNISFNPVTQKIGGISKHQSPEIYSIIKTIMHRFAEFSKQLVLETAPIYGTALEWGRTSYRPAEIGGRTTSVTKDDTLVHVDAFTATPVQGKRILRVFSNINPFDQPRLWETGEEFSKVADKFLPQVKPYKLFQAKMLKNFKLTKSLRTEYDHIMLNIHDTMKKDFEYQKNLKKQQIPFPAQSTWIVYTDQVSHAALSGQFLLEQTFYLPVEAMSQPEYAPINQIKKIIL